MAKFSKYYIVGFILFYYLSLFTLKAQNTVADSLEKVLQKTTDSKAKLNILSQLTEEYSTLSLDKSVEFGAQAVKMAQQLKEPLIEGKACLSMADAYGNEDKFELSNQHYQDAIELFTQIRYNKGIAEAYNGIGLNHYYSGKYDESLKNYKQVFEIAKQDKIEKEEADALFYSGQVYRKKNITESAISSYNKAIGIYKFINDNNGLAKVYNSLGLLQSEQGNYRNAMEYYENALVYRKITGDKKSSAILYNNLANMLSKLGKYEKAISYYQQGLKIFESIGMQEGIATCSNNIGLVYENLTRGNQYSQNLLYHSKALEYHEKALKIWQKIGNDFEIANLYSNIGNVYAVQSNEKLIEKYGQDWENTLQKGNIISKEYSKAIEFYKKALTIREKIGDKKGVAISYSNIGKIYRLEGNLTQSLIFLEHALKLNEELRNENEISSNLFGIGRVYYNLKNYAKALDYYTRSLEIAKRNENTEIIKNIYPYLSDVYLGLGDCYKTQWAYKKFVQISDSLSNENSMKQIAEIQTQYETEKKEQQIQILNKDAKLKDIEIKQKNTFLWFVVAGLLLVLVITVLLIKQNKERKKTNEELAEKNSLITFQKTEITDSIHYARRIQSAVMPTEHQIRQFLPNSFIYFRPRDIVSGDFYWVAEKNGKIAVAAADCTGHGVPGAFMSMLGTALLTNITANKEELHADEILNELRFHIINSLHQTGKEGENKDGMDIAFYVLDIENLSLEYAGANNSLYVIRNGELLESKADRMPIGIHEKVKIPFTKKIISLEKGDLIYTFSDGYHDQFGGENNKKFTSVNFKKLLVKIHQEPIDKQPEILQKTIVEWMNNNSQVDDMLIIGVKV